MKKIISLLLAVAMLVGVVFVLAGCKAKDEGAVINVYLGNEIFDFDPSDYYADSNQDQLMSLLFEPLFRVNAKGKLEMAAADDYEIDEEARKITVTLRETYWSDGVLLKAEDYAYAWCNRILDANNPNPAAALFYDIENAAAVKSGIGSVSDIGVKATETDELQITYRAGADVDRLLRNLASVAASPVRQSVFENAPGYWSKNPNTMVFNGPFKIRVLNAMTSEFSLERNTGYHQAPDERDLTDEVRPHILAGFYTATGEKMEISYADITEKVRFFLLDAPLSEREENKANATYKDDTSVYTYVFNTENPLFRNAKVRRALSMVIDRETIAAAVSFGKAANGFIPDAFGGSSAELISTTAKITEAQALIAQAKLEDDVFNAASKSFTLTVANTEQAKAIAELVKASWKTLGFTVTVKYETKIETTIGGIDTTDSELQVLLKEASYGKRNFDVIGIDWQLYTDDAFVGLASMSNSLSGCGVDFKNNNTQRTNVTGWSDNDYDSYITSAFKATGSDRATYLAEAEALLCEEAPIVPILFNQSFAFISGDLSKVECDVFGNFVFTDAKLKNYEDYLEEE